MLAALSSFLFVALALLGFGFVVFIHELGHFFFAKWAGVRVETFSLGFPIPGLPPLAAWKRGETTYQIAWLPLGGYVKMSGQEDVPTGTAEDRADPRSYLAKSAGWRALILLGGVLFNFISSYLILLGLAVWGMPVTRPIVGEVNTTIIDQHGLPVPSPAAELGLERGDRIVAVGGQRVRSYESVLTDVILSGDKPLHLQIERRGQRLELPAPGAAPVYPVFAGRFGRPDLGLTLTTSDRIIDLDPAEAPDGLRRFDRIVAVAGTDVTAMAGQQVDDLLLSHYREPVAVTVERGGRRLDVTVVYTGTSNGPDAQLPLPVRIRRIGSDVPAAGLLRPGDLVTAVDGHPVCGYMHFLALVRRAIDADGRASLSIRRGDESLDLDIPAARVAGVARLGVEPEPVVAGHLPILPPALDGTPGPLAAAGLQAGDALIAWHQSETGLRIGWVRGGQRHVLSLGMDTAAWQGANRERNPNPFARLFHQGTQPGLAERLSGRRVAEVRPTAVVLAGPETGDAQDVVDLPMIGQSALAGLQAGDWITDARLIGGNAEIEVVRGAGEPAWAEVAVGTPGTAILRITEDQPYQASGPGDAFALVNDTAYDLVVKGVMLLPRLFRTPEQGGVDPNKSLTGPIGIFRVLKQRVEIMGFASFLKMIALVGLNLFVVNLLPIPITDGGQLLILGVETAIRRPLPLKLRNGLLFAGVGIVGLLFIYICGLDILRLIGF